jgi:arylsulfatase A-like enzyme
MGIGRSVLCFAAAVLVRALPAAPQQPPVILISIDTLRADHLSSYGYRAIHTPNIDSFAQRGSVFSSVASQVPLTLPSHYSLFTSTYPFESGVEENAERIPQSAVTLASVLNARGYKTAAFIGSVFLERETGMDRGFEVYDSPFHFEAFSPISGEMFPGIAGRAAPRDRRDGSLVVHAAARWIGENRDHPLFAFVHLYDLHFPYRIRRDDPRRRGVSGYDAELEYVDGVLGWFRQQLVSMGLWDRALVVVLSDHGESLGDHGEDSHGYFIYRSTVHVPLIVHWPAEPLLPAKVTKAAGLIDVAPTILDVLRIPVPPSFHGASLLHGGPAAVYSESMHAHDAFGWAPLRAIREGEYRFIEVPKPELYDLAADPGEHRNVIAAHPDRARALREELDALVARYPARPAAPQTGNSGSVLRSLGYLASGPRRASEAVGPDPKDRLPDYRLYESADADIYEGNLHSAESLLVRLLAKDPSNLLARRDLGSVYYDLGQYPKARASLEQVLEQAPDDFVTRFLLGLACKYLGFEAQARAHLEVACSLAPEAGQCRRELDALRAQKK